ncbi:MULTISPECIES: MetQ/NlpA family ABC transporter substrate-binding protein [Paenibacillus]|jgi:D-methionine transport system substrate-binding protein|uniref:MetQ/NlpA family ABC transporter substrate-binding protein n=1 Tax=Paenibacillus TaxID=44249 RepID=UPI000472E310|nr:MULTISPECIES: MetQ/NlpA family ABC transporter substrate-binding protein [Paenibacillus]APB77790.1 metal ABC transporter substrate-binding protein [Paenibacillus polymyxa]POR28182.1 metal ABC transporter substrate-binding protein [Paenibacillus polymyxa]QYK65430.1 putative D-methionine-binding lipoprotein MetQ [Paenibacillus sp. S02]SFR19760.1 D-methionine transport system substrate-binding protein [Paenibacillus sp. cl130]
MRKSFVLLLGISLLLVAAGCGNKSSDSNGSSAASGSETQKVVIGSMGSDAQIWKHIAQSQAAKDAKLDIEVKEINGGIETNNATKEGEVDVNAFQSWAYLVSYNKESKADLKAIATTYLEPMGIYSQKFKSIDEVTDGALVALADNPANTARGLKLLEASGLIKLKADFNDALGTVNDITSNPKNLKFELIDDKTGPRVIQDVGLVLIGNTIALEGGLNVLKDSLFHEEISQATKNNINVLVTSSDKANDKGLQKLADLYHNEDTQKYIKDEFGGTKVEVKEPVSYLEGQTTTK